MSLKHADAARRMILFEEQDGLCFYCTEPMRIPPPSPKRQHAPRDLTLEHLTPFSEGGRRGFQNEVAACNACNSARGVMPWLLFYCLKEIERGNPADRRIAA